MIRIAVADDHPLVIDGLAGLFRNHPAYEWIGGFVTGKECLEKIRQCQPDLLFLDVALPDADGVTLCKELKEQLPAMKVIALTSFAEVAVVKNMLARGADGYLLKSADHKLILEAVEKVMSGQQFLDPEMQKMIIADSLGHKPRAEFIPRLTRREQEVLRLIAEEMTTSEIADRLYINHKTVETHRMNLIQKFGVKNMAGLIRAAMEKGLLQ
ncbi:MAG: response regulator [Cyclobacteriaceae bacterium]